MDDPTVLGVRNEGDNPTTSIEKRTAFPAICGLVEPAKHHDPVMLFPARAHSKKCRKKKKTVSVAVSYSEIAIAVLPRRRLGRLQKLAFLQERDDRFPTSPGAK